MQVFYTNIKAKQLVLEVESKKPFFRRLLSYPALTPPTVYIGISLYGACSPEPGFQDFGIKGFPTQNGRGGLVQRKAHCDGALYREEVVG